MKTAVIILLSASVGLLVSCIWITPPAVASPSLVSSRDALKRDVEGYAIATCLTGQKDSYLKDQGDGWASVIIQRGKGDLKVLESVAAAVRAEAAVGQMAIIRSDGNAQRPDKELPILYCNEIIDAPKVHAAITRAEKRLAAAYR
jgi:hypothetical protein